MINKKIIFILALLAVGSLTLIGGQNAVAVEPLLVVPDDAPGGGLQRLTDQTAQAAGFSSTTSPETGLAKIVGSIARVFISLIGVVFISYTIYGGYLWMTAAGNEENISKAKSIITNGIIGIIVILAAAAIYYFVFNILNPGAAPSGGGSSTSGGTP